MNRSRSTLWFLFLATVIPSGCGGDGAIATCNGALAKAKECGVTSAQIDSEELCLGMDDQDVCFARCVNSSSCSEIVAYFSGQQMNSLGDCASKCNE